MTDVRERIEGNGVQRAALAQVFGSSIYGAIIQAQDKTFFTFFFSY